MKLAVNGYARGLGITCALLGVAAIILPSILSGWILSHLIWMIMTATLAFSAWRAGRWLCKGNSYAVLFLISSLLFQIMASAFVVGLGLLGKLSLPMMMISLGALSAILAFIPVPARPRLVWFPAMEHVMIVFLCVSWAAIALKLIILTPVDSDLMWYHLPMVAEWIRTGSTWPSDCIPMIARGYPGFREAVVAFLALPIRNEHLGLLGILEYPLFGVSIYVLTRHFHSSRFLAGAVACYAITAPIVCQETRGNDLSAGVNLCLAVLFCSLALKRPTLRSAIVAGLALGALASTKYPCAIQACLVGMGVLIVAFWKDSQARKSNLFNFPLRYWMALLAAVMLVAGPWYLRNLGAFGNPFYPSEIKIAGLVVFKGSRTIAGFRDSTLGWDVAPLIRHAQYFVQAFGILVPLLAAGPLWVFVGKLAKWHGIRTRVLLGLLPILVFLAFLHLPYSVPIPQFGYAYTMRYLIGWFAISAVAIAAAVGRNVIFSKAVSVAFLIAAFANICEWNEFWLIRLAAVAACIIGIFALRSGQIKKPISGNLVSPKVVAVAGLSVLLSASLFIDWLRGNLQYHPRYGYRDSGNVRCQGWGEISRFVHGNLSNNSIVVYGRWGFFPLYGDHFTNRVHFIPSSKGMINDCRENGADYVVVFGDPKEGKGSEEGVNGKQSRILDVIRQYPDAFSLEHRSMQAFLFKVNSSRLPLARNSVS